MPLELPKRIFSASAVWEMTGTSNAASGSADPSRILSPRQSTYASPRLSVAVGDHPALSTLRDSKPVRVAAAAVGTVALPTSPTEKYVSTGAP